MTADVELLDLSSPLSLTLSATDAARVCAYARANVAHATAAKDAEIEALRRKLRDVAGAEQSLVEARSTIDQQEERIEALRAEVERLMTIAGWGGLAGDAPDRLILASEMFDGIACCDKWLTVRRICDGDHPVPESATAYVRADIAEQAEARAELMGEALREIERRMPQDQAGPAWIARTLAREAITAAQENDDVEADTTPGRGSSR